MKKDGRKLSPREWEPFFRKANVRTEDLDACKGRQSKAIKMGLIVKPVRRKYSKPTA